jgi:glucose-1-phosphate adenylyltransferase
VVILAGDHIYKMDYSKLVERHKETNADLTVATLKVPLETAAGQFGVLEVDMESRVMGFEEKPLHPKPIPSAPTHALASMGVYVITARFLFEQLCLDATRHGSQHDFGHDLIPSVIHTHRVFAYPFMDENRNEGKKKEAYWRDVGTLDAYYEANMDLVSVDPLLNMYDDDWPIRTYQPNLPPPKFVFAEKGAVARRGQALDSIVCQGCIVSGGQLERSIVGPDSRINSYAQVEDSILFEGVNVGRHAKIRRAIIDKGVQIPQGIEIGYDHNLDRSRGFMVSEKGITVIAKTHGMEHLVDKGKT